MTRILLHSAVLSAVLLAGCAQTRIVPEPAAAAPAPSPTPAPSPAAPPAAPSESAVVQRLHHDASAKAAKLAEAGDFEGAAGALVAIIPALAKHPELSNEFWAHNAMMMIRAAQGDPAAALAENDQATLSAARGTWEPEERTKLAFQKDRWHRAYLTRMLAESRTGSTKAALIQYAEAALADYRPTGYPDSIAILDAYFAALDGKKEAALAAAKRIDTTKNDDIEDLYLVVVGLEAGGDHAAAEAVRTTMRKTKPGGAGRAIMLRWLDIDARPARPGDFSPWRAQTR